VDGARCSEREQRDCLRDRDADGAAWVYSGESVLHRGVCGKYPFVGQDASGALAFLGGRFRLLG
jgi:hypothetical protein